MKLAELIHIALAVIVLAFSVSFMNLSIFPASLIFLAVIFFVNVSAKKLCARLLHAATETKIWHFQRFGFYERSYFKTPIPIGIILPFLLSILSLGRVSWLAATETEILATKARVAKSHGIYRFSEMTDGDIGLIIGSGIFACLILAVISYFLNFPALSRLAILFSLFNLIPIGKLDGTKIFFGSIVLWFILASLSLIGLAYVIFLI